MLLEADMLVLNPLIAVGEAGIASSFLCLVALHILPTPVNPLSDAICDHASYRYGQFFNAQGIATGMSGLCLAALIVKSVHGVSRFGLVALLVFSISRLALFFFPSDVKPPRTARGIVHMVLDVIMFIGISYATGFLSYSRQFARMNVALCVTAVLTETFVTLTAIVLAVPCLRKFMGLNERFLYCSILLWFGLAFAALL
jgi:hypothetical protein